MKKYCPDTSGFSNPVENMPQDIHSTLWQRIATCVTDGIFAVTTEIYKELILLSGPFGDCMKNNRDLIRLEVGDGSWEWERYIGHVKRMQSAHRRFISEYNGNRKGTVCLNDISIIVMAKTMKLPVISMEHLIREPESKSRRIPNICKLEKVRHLTFSDFLREEGIQL